jgi:hypothetical protein
MLLDPALQLPHPEPNEQRHHREREQPKTSDATPSHLCLDHFGSRSISRPSAALWWYCSAIRSDFIERNGNSVVARISGSQSTACSQNGGVILDLDDQGAADDDGAGNHDDENRRPIARVDKGIV